MNEHQNAPADADNPAVAIRARGEQGDVPLAKESAATGADKDHAETGVRPLAKPNAKRTKQPRTIGGPLENTLGHLSGDCRGVRRPMDARHTAQQIR